MGDCWSRLLSVVHEFTVPLYVREYVLKAAKCARESNQKLGEENLIHKVIPPVV